MADPPSAPARDVAERDAFELLLEIAGVMRSYLDELEQAALVLDRARARLHACQISRATRSMLVTVKGIMEGSA